MGGKVRETERENRLLLRHLPFWLASVSFRVNRSSSDSWCEKTTPSSSGPSIPVKSPKLVS